MYFIHYLRSLGDWRRLTLFRLRVPGLRAQFPQSLACFVNCVSSNITSTESNQSITVRLDQFTHTRLNCFYLFLGYLELENNALTGSIPSELANIVELQQKLDLSHNQLSGSVPTELGLLIELSKLFVVDVFYSFAWMLIGKIAWKTRTPFRYSLFLISVFYLSLTDDVAVIAFNTHYLL